MRKNDIGFRIVLSVQQHENINGKTKGKSVSSEQSSSKVPPVHPTARKLDPESGPSGNDSQNDDVVPPAGPQPPAIKAPAIRTPAIRTPATKHRKLLPKPPTGSDEVMVNPVIGMELVSVPGGCFQMGSPDNEKERSNNEGPRHKVCVDGFRMGKYEVTQGQWVKIMGSNPSQYQKGDEYPVEKVSWNKIQEFITKLNKQSGREYRLPTEWEWEYAARAGTSTARYWGDDISCDRAMYGNDKYQEQVSCMDYIRSEEALTPYSTAPVGSYPPNRFGLYDMLGNVSEFCSNWLGDYPSAQLNNPQGPAKGNIRVFRGGALGSSESGIRSAFRWGLPLHERNYGIGFRLVLPGL
jgi:formylglycine-generating enzyme required for sulfatase activity